jgi:hypothetical protein
MTHSGDNVYRNVLIFTILNVCLHVCFRVLMQPDNADPELHLEPRGPVVMKGRAEPMQVYFLSRAKIEE